MSAYAADSVELMLGRGRFAGWVILVASRRADPLQPTQVYPPAGRLSPGPGPGLLSPEIPPAALCGRLRPSVSVGRASQYRGPAVRDVARSVKRFCTLGGMSFSHE